MKDLTKDFPDDPAEIVSFAGLVDPVYEAAKRLYPYLGRSRSHEKALKGTHFDGFRIESPCNLSPEEHLTEEGLSYQNERGRPPFAVCLMIAAQLGIEQGKRIATRDYRQSSEHRTLQSLLTYADRLVAARDDPERVRQLINHMADMADIHREYRRGMDELDKDIVKRRRKRREKQKAEQGTAP